MALEAGVPVESLQQMIYQGDGNEITLLDKLEENENQSEHVVDRLFLEELLGGLDGKERDESLCGGRREGGSRRRR